MHTVYICASVYINISIRHKCVIIVNNSNKSINPHHLRGEERERESKVTAIFARVEEYILFLCSVLSDLCLALSGACLSPVFSLLFAALCQSTELKCHLIEPTVFRGWGGFAAPKQAC